MTPTLQVGVTEAEFLRRFLIRAPNLMWFVGAGTSAAAGVPTAADMVWDFKRLLFCTDQRVSPSEVADLANPAVPVRIQVYLDGTGKHPPDGAAEEYSHYFEAAYAHEADRRAYINGQTTGVRPSYGQFALATLLHAQKARVIWTTNFDGLIEDACADTYGTTTALTVATPDASDIATHALQEERWPILVKLHGDFRSRRLRNTSDEIRTQDAQLRHALVDACGRSGLVVAGFSGRDDSVMSALEEACKEGGFPSGLFWLHHGESRPLPRVEALITVAQSHGIDAGIVEIGSFDELAGDLARQFPDITEELRARLDRRRQRLTDRPTPGPGRGWPVLRTNAIEVIEWPTVARRVVCSIGGVRELQAAVSELGADVLAVRTQAGVLAFGADADVKRILEPFGIDVFDLYPIERRRLYRDTHERELLYQALAGALVRDRPLRVVRRRGTRFLVPVPGGDQQLLATLAQITGGMSGELPRSRGRWSEALAIRLDFALGRLWVLIEPRIWFEEMPDRATKAEAASFARERFANRYNRVWNRLFDAWTALLNAGREDTVLRALDVSDGIDAPFRLARVTAFTRPGAA